MKIKKNSWHYKLMAMCYPDYQYGIQKRTTVCMYWIRVLGTIFLLGVLLGIACFELWALSYPLYSIFFEHDTSTYYGTLIFSVFFWPIFGSLLKEYTTPDMFKEKKWFHKKVQICEYVEFED